MPKYVVRYGATRMLGVFSVRGGDRYSRGANVIARTDRGLEVGEVLAVANEESLERLGQSGQGQILRMMSSEDQNEWDHIQTRTRSEFAACQRNVDQLGLDMQLVDLEHLFGGERIVVYYLSEERVDFRELVRKLASEFQTRIEMRQIGVRDEAKLLADYGDCGKPVCCNTHLSSMPPVSMKMAKLQKATLDPTKISGRCGRLKCCLRYEYDMYVEMQAELPPPGSDVITREGRCRVVSQSILAQQLMVEMEDHRRILISASDVLTVLRRGSTKGKKDAAAKKKRGRGQSAEGAGAAGKQAEGSPTVAAGRDRSGPDAESRRGRAKPRKNRRPARADEAGPVAPPNTQAPNTQAPDDEMPDDQTPNKQLPERRPPDSQSPQDSDPP